MGHIETSQGEHVLGLAHNILKRCALNQNNTSKFKRKVEEREFESNTLDDADELQAQDLPGCRTRPGLRQTLEVLVVIHRIDLPWESNPASHRAEIFIA